MCAAVVVTTIVPAACLETETGGGGQADGAFAEVAADAASEAESSFGAFVLKVPPVWATGAGHMFGISDNLQPIDEISKIMRDALLRVRAAAAEHLRQAPRSGARAADAIEKVQVKSFIRMSQTTEQKKVAYVVARSLRTLAAKMRSPPEETLLPSHQISAKVEIKLNSTLARFSEAREKLIGNFANAFRAVRALNKAVSQGKGRYCWDLAAGVDWGANVSSPRNIVGDAVKHVVSSAAQKAVPPSVLEHARNFSDTLSQKATAARVAATQLLLRASRSSGLHNITKQDVQEEIKAAGERLGLGKQAEWLGGAIHDGWDECTRAQAFVADANRSVEEVSLLVTEVDGEIDKILSKEVPDATDSTKQRLMGLISKVMSSSQSLPSTLSSQVLAAGSLAMSPTSAEQHIMQMGLSKAHDKLAEAQVRLLALRRAAADLSSWSGEAAAHASESAAERKRRQHLRHTFSSLVSSGTKRLR